MDVDWYYVSSSGAQCGPSNENAFKSAFVSGQTNEGCLCWNESMSNWTTIKDVPGLLQKLRPAPVVQAPPVNRGPPPRMSVGGPPPGAPPASAGRVSIGGPPAGGPPPGTPRAFAAPQQQQAAAPVPQAPGAPAAPPMAPAITIAPNAPAAPGAPGMAPSSTPRFKAPGSSAPAATTPTAASGTGRTSVSGGGGGGGQNDLFSAIAAGVGGLRKTSGAGAGGRPSVGERPAPVAAAATTPRFAAPGSKFNAPSATTPTAAASTPTAASGATTPRFGAGGFGMPPRAQAVAITPVAEDEFDDPSPAKPSIVTPRTIVPSYVPKSKQVQPEPVKAAATTSSNNNNNRSQPAAAASKPSSSTTDDHEGWYELMTPEGIPYYHNKHTNQTTWDKPAALQGDDEREKQGTWVWCPDNVHAFVPAKLLETYYDGRMEVEKEDGTKMTLPKGSNLEELTWSSLRRPVRDLVMLDVMNQPLILHNLKTRFEKNEIYTNIGTILISMNPYTMLPLYTPTMIESYRSRGTKDMAPHIYTIADDSYNSLCEKGISQSIVISGESGAGKTECTKQCLQFLAEVAGSTSNVENRILQANPILEAFGNAKTIRNNNSSRFGKYVEIFFDKRQSICGASNTNYLLEKVRVIQQTGDERNYHIFYQLCSGATPEQRKSYSIPSSGAEHFSYLNQSGNIHIDGVNDGQDFREVIDSMNALNFTAAEQSEIFSTVAWILHLGNLQFRETGDKKCEVVNRDVLQIVSTLMKVEEKALMRGITNRVMAVRGQQPMDISLSMLEAQAARDGLSKHVFSRLFDWLVTRINSSIGIGEGQKGRSIGILDIFGFEIFQLNSFEQLCINFANEKLQQFFNNYTFKLEETVYQQEKIAFQHVSYIDNQPVLDLIEAKPKGILPGIDEELRMPNGNDKTFIDKLHLGHVPASKPYGKVLSNPMQFIVRHYAGEVIYGVEGFLVKNKDRLNEDLHDLLQTSKCTFLKNLFPPEDAAASSKSSLGIKFRTQLDELMTTLNATQPHYVRCIKPNAQKQAMVYDGIMVLQQLQYSGVFEAITIRKQGFPFRLSHIDFYKRFKCILPKKSWGTQYKKASEDLINAMGQDTKSVQLGLTRVLYRADQHKDMELKRNIAVESTVIYLQRRTRGWLARRIAKALKKHKPLLRAAMKIRELAKVEQALSEASGLRFPLKEWEEAKRLRIQLIEEARVTKLLEGFLALDPEEQADNLQKGLAAADDCGLTNNTTTKARAVLVEVKDRQKTRLWLDEGAAEADIEKLNWALKRCDELKLPRVAEPQRKAKEMKERILREEKIISSLEDALKRDGYIRDNDRINSAPLKKVLQEANTFVMKTKNGIALNRQAELFVGIRDTMSKALGTKDKALWRAVEEVVIRAGEYHGDHPEVQKAREEVSHQAAVDDICEKIQHAVEQLDQEQLTYGLQQAESLNVDVVKYPVVPVAKEYLSRIVECRRLMQVANTQVEQVALEYAIQYAESFGYDKEEVRQTRTLRDTVIQLNVEAAHANIMLEEEPMKSIVQRADAVKLSTPDIEKLRTLLYSTAEEKFVQLQLKAAVALKDPSRAIRVTIRLKDLFFKKSGPMFAWENYAKLRSKEGWADMKFVSFNREELAAGMRKHTKEPIHDPLTEVTDDKHVKALKNMFKNILGFMGDRQYNGPMLLASELCQFALSEKWARDEIYCQLIKQLTSNPNSDSMNKGWWLLAICLETFPPPPEFENYLEMWLRTKCTEGAQRDRYVRLLHSTVYGGQRQAPLTESEMNQVLAGESLRANVFESKTSYATPQASLPQRQQAQAIMGVIPQSAGGKGMAGYNPNAGRMTVSSYAPPEPAYSQDVMRRGPPGMQQQQQQQFDAPPPPPPEEDVRPPCQWAIAYHPDSHEPYYYNINTNETTWDRPADYYE